MAILENFEGGTVDDFYDETIGDGWTVNASNRTTGFAQPVYRPLPDPVYDIPSAAGGSMGLGFNGSSAWAVSVDYSPSSGLGGYFHSDSGGAGGFTALSMQVSVGFTHTSALGSITVARYGNTLTITEFYDDLVTYVDNETTVALTDFLPSEYLPVPSGVWLEVSFRKGAGWVVRDAISGATLASGSYPYAISAAAAWELNYVPNESGPGGPSGSLRGVVDDLYGWPGSGGPAVRLYPRDDGRGMSTAPRIYPPPKNRRIVGGMP